jgi:hypothetical protein
VAHAHGVGSVHVHSACTAHGHAGARPTLAEPASACVARNGAAHAGAVTTPGHASRRAGGDAAAVEAAQMAAVEHP